MKVALAYEGVWLGAETLVSFDKGDGDAHEAGRVYTVDIGEVASSASISP
jgi:hypothetical protein